MTRSIVEKLHTAITDISHRTLELAEKTIGNLLCDFYIDKLDLDGKYIGETQICLTSPGKTSPVRIGKE